MALPSTGDKFWLSVCLRLFAPEGVREVELLTPQTSVYMTCQGEKYHHGPAASFGDLNLFFFTILVISNTSWIDRSHWKRRRHFYRRLYSYSIVIGKIICYISGGWMNTDTEECGVSLKGHFTQKSNWHITLVKLDTWPCRNYSPLYRRADGGAHMLADGRAS